MGEKKRRLAMQAQQAGTAPRPPQTDGARALEVGLQAHRAGRLVDAINAYNDALRRSPGMADAQHYLGLALLQSGQQVLGLHWVKQSVQAAPANAQFRFNLGNALRDFDKGAALEQLQQAAALDPADHGSQLACGELLEEAGRFDEAVAAFERARALQPGRWETLKKLARLHYETNRIAQAREYLAAGIALHPPLAEEASIGEAAPGIYTGSRGTNIDPASLGKDSKAAALSDFVRDAGMHIIDDFLPDPDAYRAAALSLPFRERNYKGQNYPGIQTAGTACQGIMDRIAHTLGMPIKFNSPDNGSYRLSFADSTARSDIHVDNEHGNNIQQFAAVLYLNFPQQCQGGTSFWRHRPTGWDRRPSRDALRQNGYDDYRAFRRRWLPNTEEIGFNELKTRREAWDLILEVPMRYNRLVFYRSHFFHSISDVFGTSREDARFVQLFTFEAMV